ncbi:MAG: hypothetical protein RSA27_08865 [Oscillospiraceae bacterium]
MMNKLEKSSTEVLIKKIGNMDKETLSKVNIFLAGLEAGKSLEGTKKSA